MRLIGYCTRGLIKEVTTTGDVQSGSRFAADEVVATVAGEAVVFTGLNALRTIELDT